ncbi:hypothetical protein [Kordiimonas sp. SCSIO 12610]|uniref:hypothetical protein n=1 Tax=Kordiimonas sp. SCSIO 12610 TaxID=2829597 RepID=UPI00210EDC1C|nr:hypothetical protein [Kordiimonas sp. SCSIO 12610]UTW55311.1 hypothetical protein KFF44_16135 [Kordiimonas sp. SCSIO 12610]
MSKLRYSFFFLSSLILPQETFLEGFPDVPILEGMVEIHPEGRFVFDTPSGTIAETIMISDYDEAEAIKRYSVNLIALGWNCTQSNIKLLCTRDQHRLILDTKKSTEKKTLINIRVEPNKE